MSLLLPVSRRHIDEFASTLDSRTTTDPSVTSLFSLAEELAAMPLGPSAEFRSALRNRLVTMAADPPPRVVRTSIADRLTADASDWFTGWRGQRQLAFAAGLVAVALLVAGVGLLGSRSAPGGAFYAVKRAAENVQLATAHGKLAKGHRHLEFAATRLREVTALLDRNSALVAAGPERAVAGRLALSEQSTKLVLSTLSDMDHEIVAGTRDLTEYWRESGQEPPLHTLDIFANGQRAKLAAVLPTLPVSARTPGLQVLERLTTVRQRAEDLIAQGPCDVACRRIAGGATMSGGFDTLGPLPCPSVCPGSGGTSAPVAIVKSVSPTPESSPSPSPSPSLSPPSSPAPLSTFSAEPFPSEPPDPSLPTSPLPTLSPSPSPVESTSPPIPVETSAAPSPPSPAPSLEPSPTESSSSPSPTDDPASPTPSAVDPTETGSPEPVPSVLPFTASR